MSDLTVHEGGKIVKGRGRPKVVEKGRNAGQRKIEKFHDVAAMITAGVLRERFAVIENNSGNNKGIRNIIRINSNNEACYVEDEYLAYELINYAKTFLAVNDDYLWTFNDAMQIVKIFKATEPIEEPVKLAFLSNPNFCFKRLPFDYQEKDKYVHPTWDKLMNNVVKNKETFKCFIGSIFIDLSYCQQYLWLYGSGGDGKGTILNYLNSLLGSDICKPLSTNIKYEHWSESLPGLRVGYFSDCKHYGLPNTGEFLAVSGGDNIPINPKGKKSFYIKNTMKFIFASNNLPVIDHVDSNVRRALIIEFKKMQEFNDHIAFKSNIEAEGIEFINDCINLYLKKYSNHQHLAMDDDYDIEDVTSEAEANKQAFLDEHFGIEIVEEEKIFNNPKTNEQLKGKDIFKGQYYVTGKRFTQYLNKFYSRDLNQHTNLKQWMRQRWGIIYTKKDLAPKDLNKKDEDAKKKDTRIYKGLRELDPKTRLI